MLELLGSGYVIEHCTLAFLQNKKQQSYQYYIAECLRIISENTAKFGGGSYVQVKIQDVLEPKPVDNRTADDVIESIRNKLK